EPGLHLRDGLERNRGGAQRDLQLVQGLRREMLVDRVTLRVHRVFVDGILYRRALVDIDLQYQFTCFGHRLFGLTLQRRNARFADMDGAEQVSRVTVVAYTI